MSGYQVQGRPVAMPVQVRDASAATVIYDVPLDAARQLLPSEAFAPVESSPGRAQLAIGLIDYRDNDLGAYHEVGVILFVRPRAGGPDGTFITRLPVDQEFTCAAGRTIWGFPKSVERIEVSDAPGSSTWALWMDGELVLRLTVPAEGAEEMTPMDLVAYTLLDGVPHATSFTQGGTESSIGFGEGVVLELGAHPVAQELAALGLPATPVLSTWTGRMRATFHAPVPISP